MTYCAFTSDGSGAIGAHLVYPAKTTGFPAIQQYEIQWGSKAGHARDNDAAILVDYEPTDLPRVLDATHPGYLAKSRAAATVKQLTTYADVTRAHCLAARAVCPTRMIAVYMAPVSGAIQYAGQPPMGAWRADNARIARTGAYALADALAVGAYLHSDDAAWMTPALAGKYVAAKLDGAAVYGVRRIACLSLVYQGDGRDVPVAVLRGKLAAVPAGVDVIWWAPASDESTMRANVARVREAVQ